MAYGRFFRGFLVVAVSSTCSCGGGEGERPPAIAGTEHAEAERRPASSGPTLPKASRGFENPGGMWMPHQMLAHAQELRALGIELDPAALADPVSGLLSAVVSLGGCSASFVSNDGLIATNHHCATGALQHNSTPDQNLLKQGWLAKTRAEEKNNGPQARVYVTRAIREVTDAVTNGLGAIQDDRARFKAIESRQKEVIASCEQGPDKARKNGVRCSVVKFYGGAKYFAIEQMEIRDVRLVWAPPAGVGNYGGEIDNWRWPRHTGDVSLFRAYVGKDGEAADYAADNVPYHPQHVLKVAPEGVKEGDLVFVAGYPGHTETLATKADVDEAVDWYYPRRQKLFEEYLARIEQATQGDKEAQIRANGFVRGFNNALTNTKGQLEGLVKGGLAKGKAEEEAKLRAFIEGDPERKSKWGGALDAIAQAAAEQAATRDGDILVKDELRFPKLVGAASTIVKMAEERPKMDAEREPDFQERNWSRFRQALSAIASSYHPRVDEALLALALERASERVRAGSKDPSLTKLLERAQTVGKAAGAKLGAVTEAPSSETIRAIVKALYAKTKLADEKTRLALFEKASSAELAKSRDPLVALAVALRPLVKQAEERQERWLGKMAIVRPKVVLALEAWKKGNLAPEANGTLRLTYGTVRGYRPSPSAPVYPPFTRLSEVSKKHTGQEPFDAPKVLLEAIEAKRWGPYVHPALGEVPVDFLADLHITGGNSGSATLNAKGELVGLVFDGNYEAMASDWVFVPEVTRSIHVDIRYVLWLLDGVFDGDHLLKEMGVEPKIDARGG